MGKIPGQGREVSKEKRGGTGREKKGVKARKKFHATGLK